MLLKSHHVFLIITEKLFKHFSSSYWSLYNLNEIDLISHDCVPANAGCNKIYDKICRKAIKDTCFSNL